MQLFFVVKYHRDLESCYSFSVIMKQRSFTDSSETGLAFKKALVSTIRNDDSKSVKVCIRLVRKKEKEGRSPVVKRSNCCHRNKHPDTSARAFFTAAVKGNEFPPHVAPVSFRFTQLPKEPRHLSKLGTVARFSLSFSWVR